MLQRVSEEAMCRASCAYFAQQKLRGPAQAPYNGRFLLGRHHEEWDTLLHESSRICLVAARDHGKCAVATSLVLGSDGTRVSVRDWGGGYLLAYDPKSHQLVPTYSPASRPNGMRATVRVTTRTGRVDTVTLNHPFRLWDRWVQAGELQAGQRIAVPRRYPALGAHPLRPQEAWAMGALVGDGGFTGSNVTWTCADAGAVEVMRRTAADLGWELVRASAAARAFEWRLKRAQGWAREHALWGRAAHAKRVPAAVFAAPLSDVADFVAGYVDSDATVSTHGGGMVEFYSVSEHLLRDVQHLLVRLGVVAVLAVKRGRYRGAEHLSWRLTVRGRSLCTLAQLVRPRGSRGPLLAALALGQGEKEEGGSVDLLPREVCGLLRHGPGWFRGRGHPGFDPGYDMTRSKALRLAAAEGNLALHSLAAADVLWDEVVSVEDAGVQETFSIHVPGHANYCANDLVQHNTFFWDLAFPLWMADRHPGSRGYIFSGSQPQANRILDDIKLELENNPKLAHLLPKHPRRLWSSTVIELANGSRMYAKGFGVRTRGAHPDWVVCDDVLNDEDATSETVRERNKNYFFSAVSGMVPPHGKLIVVGTPFHALDLYSELERNPQYTFRRYPAIDEKGQALWPARYPLERLYAKREEISPIRFTREFLCQTISDDMSLFPTYLFRGQPTEQFNVRLGMPGAYWDSIGVKDRYIGVDLAISATTGSDYTVVFIIGLDDFGNRWVIDIIRVQGMPFREQQSLIMAACRKYDPRMVFIEANQMQRVFGDELILTTDLPIHKFITAGTGKSKTAPKANTTVVNKHTLEGGVPQLRMLFENRKWRIPKGDVRSMELTGMWEAEMNRFTWSGGKVVSVGHDDMAMACWIADQAARRGGFTFTTGDEEMEKDLDKILASQRVETQQTEDERKAEEEAAEAFLVRMGVKDAKVQEAQNYSLVDEKQPAAVDWLSLITPR